MIKETPWSKRKLWTFCIFKRSIWRQIMGLPGSAILTSIAVATRQVKIEYSYLQQNMLFLVKSNPKISSRALEEGKAI